MGRIVEGLALVNNVENCDHVEETEDVCTEKEGLHSASFIGLMLLITYVLQLSCAIRS